MSVQVIVLLLIEEDCVGRQRDARVNDVVLEKCSGEDWWGEG